MKTSKVTQLIQVLDPQSGQPKTYSGDYGLMYFHKISFENGDVGEYMHKESEQKKFTFNEVTDYEFIPRLKPEYADRIKPVQKEFNSGFKTNGKPSNNRSFALSYAKDIVVALIEQGSKTISPNKTIEIANTFVKWLDEQPSPGSKVIQDKPDNISVDQSELVDGYKPPPAEGSDLPF